MEFVEVLEKVLELLQRQSRASYRALTTALRTSNAQLCPFLFAPLRLGKLVWPTFRVGLQSLQRLLEQGQQVMDPGVDPCLAQREHLAQQCLERGGFLIDQNQQQFLLQPLQLPFAPSAHAPVARLTALANGPGPGLFVDLTKRGQQQPKLFGSQARQRSKLSSLLLQLGVFKHPPSLAYFG